MGSDAKLKTVGRVPKGAPTSAKPMEVGNGAAGVLANVTSLLAVEVGYVQPTVAWFRIEKTGEA